MLVWLRQAISHRDFIKMIAGLMQLAGATQSGWQSLQTGAGGFVVGMSIANDGTVVVRTDTYGGYIKPVGASIWTLVLTNIALPSNAWSIANQVANGAFYELVIAPSTSQVVYGIYNGFLYKSTNQCASFLQTNMSQLSGPPSSNDSVSRFFGPFMAVDPVNSSIVFVGSPSSGVQVTKDGGGSFVQISTGTIPGGTVPGGGSQGAGNCIVFDRTSSIVGGATQGIFISSYGHGIYHSTDGGSTWVELNSSGMPSAAVHLVVDVNGVLWVVNNQTGQGIYKYSGGAWTNLAVSDGTGFSAMAVNSNNTNQIVALSNGGFAYTSTNGGSTFVNPTLTGGGSGSITGDTPWLNTSNNLLNHLSIGNIQFDPVVSGQLDVCGGQFGFMYCQPFNSSTSLAYTVLSRGIEELDATFVLAPPGGSSSVIGMAWDLPLWNKSRGTFNKASTLYIPGYGSQYSLSLGYGADYATGTPTEIAAIAQEEAIDYSGYSTDGGKTWTQFGSVPGSSGGSIAASSSGNYTWAVFGGGAFYTANSGSTWSASTGLPGNFPSNPFFTVPAKFIAADKATQHIVYAYLSSFGVYKSTNDGQSFSQVFSGSIDGVVGTGNIVFVTSPTVQGDIWYSFGIQSGTHPGGSSLYRSTNGGVSWNTVGTFREIWGIGFGAQVSGQSYPSIAVVGFLNSFASSFGIYQSMDNGVTWQQVGSSWPLGIFTNFTWIDGDKQVQGQWYLAVNGYSFLYYNPV